MEEVSNQADPLVSRITLPNPMHRALSSLVALLALAPAAPAQRQAPATVAPAADSLFEFHSEFWLNLHHFLYHQARARLGVRDTQRRAVAGARGDTAGFGALPAAMRADWMAAVSTYQQTLAGRDLLLDEGLRRIKTALAALPSDGDPRQAGLDSAVAAALVRAAPVYRRLWWPRHDQANRALIAALTPQIEAHGAALARRLEGVYHAPWPAPLRVDVVAYAIWAGAYTTYGPADVTYGSLDPGNRGTQGLEILFHEASHLLVDSVLAGLRHAARTEQRDVPRDLLHAIIFYTAGDLVRREVPGHVPYAETNGLWRGPLASYRAPLEARWRPYLDGNGGMGQAIAALVADVGTPSRGGS